MVTYIRRRRILGLCLVRFIVNDGQGGATGIQLRSRRRGQLSSTGGWHVRRSSLRGAEHRLGGAGSGSGARASQGSRMVNTLVLLVATGTSATGGHYVVAAELALAAWFTRLEFSIPTIGWVQPWRLGVSVELLGYGESGHVDSAGSYGVPRGLGRDGKRVTSVNGGADRRVHNDERRRFKHATRRLRKQRIAGAVTVDNGTEFGRSWRSVVGGALWAGDRDASGRCGPPYTPIATARLMRAKPLSPQRCVSHSRPQTQPLLAATLLTHCSPTTTKPRYLLHTRRMTLQPTSGVPLLTDPAERHAAWPCIQKWNTLTSWKPCSSNISSATSVYKIASKLPSGSRNQSAPHRAASTVSTSP